MGKRQPTSTDLSGAFSPKSAASTAEQTNRDISSRVVRHNTTGRNPLKYCGFSGLVQIAPPTTHDALASPSLLAFQRSQSQATNSNPDHQPTLSDNAMMDKGTPPKAIEQSVPIRQGTANSNNATTSSLQPALKANGGAANTSATKLSTSGPNFTTHSSDNPTPTTIKLPKASTNIQWSDPIGEHIRLSTDESLMIFRRAVGINSDLAPKANRPGAAEEGLKQPMGMYRSVIAEKNRRKLQYWLLSWALNITHFAQVVIGATLTALGPNASRYTVAITVLGAVNTVIAGTLALCKGQGLPERLYRGATEFRKLQDWLEETESLIATGINGRDRKEIGVLVQSAFRKYNSAKLSEENNRPNNYVPDPGTTSGKKQNTGDSDDDIIGNTEK